MLSTVNGLLHTVDLPDIGYTGILVFLISGIVSTGARGPKVHELPLVVSFRYEIQWERTPMSLTELAKKRYFEKWSVPRLAAHFQRSPETVQMHLCCMKKPGGLEKLSLTTAGKKSLAPILKEVFKGR